MGGDHGPSVVIPAAAIASIRHPEARFLLVGDAARIEPELKAHPELAAKTDLIHTDVAIAMDAKPSQALRKGRYHSSMWLALEAVKDGRADAAVSAGNTGALMVMAKFCLKTLEGIDRPAIAAIWPTIDSECIVLDVGANVGADSRQLVEFALMGAAMARALFGVEQPTIGLLNIGVEEVKGLDEIKKAAAVLKDAPIPIRYHGFVEGDDVGRGAVDVVVTDGFTGNIALKTAEGTAKQIGEYLRAAMGRSLLARLGAVLAQGAFRRSQREDGSAPAEWRHLSGTKRHRRQKPWRHRRDRVRQRHRSCLRHGLERRGEPPGKRRRRVPRQVGARRRRIRFGSEIR